MLKHLHSDLLGKASSFSPKKELELPSGRRNDLEAHWLESQLGSAFPVSLHSGMEIRWGYFLNPLHHLLEKVGWPQISPANVHDPSWFSYRKTEQRYLG